MKRVREETTFGQNLSKKIFKQILKKNSNFLYFSGKASESVDLSEFYHLSDQFLKSSLISFSLEMFWKIFFEIFFSKISFSDVVFRLSMNSKRLKKFLRSQKFFFPRKFFHFFLEKFKPKIFLRKLKIWINWKTSLKNWETCLENCGRFFECLIRARRAFFDDCVHDLSKKNYFLRFS